MGDGGVMKRWPRHGQGMVEMFTKGISLFAMARKTRKRKYKVHARRIRSLLQSWEKSGNPNVVHYLLLLDAEWAALRGEKEDAIRFYKDAVTVSARRGFLQGAALANERFASFLLSDCNDKEEADYRIEQAVRFYSDWGANRKVVRLQQERSGDCLSTMPHSRL
jgi:hypothetical protein